jgi:hypothetical protein
MSEVYEGGDRLWPHETEQPSLEIFVGSDRYILRWDNTIVQYYRTGIEEHDHLLRRYDHVIHKYQDEGRSANYIIITFAQLGRDKMSYLLDNSYPYHTDPIPDDYILAMEAAEASRRMPDFIEPDMGEEAA